MTIDNMAGVAVRTPARMVRGAAVAAVGTLVVGLTSCSDDSPNPDPSATALAEALASGQFGSAPLASTPAADVEAAVEEIVGGMGETARSVDVRAVVPAEGEDDSVWTVTFDVSWDLAGSADGTSAGDESDDADGDNADDGATDDASSTGADGPTEGATWSYTTTAQLSLAGEGDDEQWQAEWSPALLHPDLEPGDRLRLRRQAAERAEILGAADSVLVTARDVYRIGIDKTRFDDGTSDDDMAAAAHQLADVVDVDAESFGERVLAAGDKAFVEAITFREDDAEPVLDQVESIDGARALTDTTHLAPTREFARPILGTVGKATAEIVEESGGRIQTGDVVGLSGLQRAYDERLGGRPGSVVEIVPAEGDATVVHEEEPVPGEDLATTLSLDLQMHAESVLADMEPPSALVAIQPSTGDVLVAASGPGGEGYSTATLGQYAPGSTFKVVSALALLRAGQTPDATVQCPATITVDGREFSNYSDYPDSALGDIPLRTAIAESCNTALIGLRDDAAQADLSQAAASLGLGQGSESDLGVAAFLGSAPDEADGTAHAASMIGQAEILASPLAMATVAASVAAGETVVPRMLADQEPPAPDAPALEGDEASQLQEMMRAAVDGGSASFLQDMPGEPVSAKTGTAEYGTETPPRTHAWMIAIQGDLAVAAFVEDGESGSQTAGPLLEDFLAGS